MNTFEDSEGFAKISATGITGIAIDFMNFTDEFPFFRDEVLPRLERLGIRAPREEPLGRRPI